MKENGKNRKAIITTENNTAEYRHHDDKAEQNFKDIREHLIEIKEKIDK